MKMHPHARKVRVAPLPNGWPTYRHVLLSQAENGVKMLARSEWAVR